MLQSSRGKIPIYIIGYPKSGTVWVTRLVADTLNTPSYGFNQSGRVLGNLDTSGLERQSDFEVLHCHFSVRNRHSSITPSSKIIYVVRDLRDEIVSGFFFNYRIDEKLVLLAETHNHNVVKRRFWRKLVFALEVNKLIRSWGCWSGGNSEFKFFFGVIKVVFTGGLIRRIKGGVVGNWSDHINAWMRFSPNVVVVKYEDLLVDTCQTLTDALHHLDLPYDQTTTEMVIEQHRFEKRKSFFEQQNDTENIQFMRKGVAGDWQRFLSTKMVQHIEEKHGPTMKKMGYL